MYLAVLAHLYKTEGIIVANATKKLLECYEFVKSKTDFKPRVALVLGSGLGDFASCIDIHSHISYSDIKDFPVSFVSGHNNRFIFGSVSGVDTVIMQGRVHYYEGYDMADVVLPIRLMRMLGADTLLLTNAAGAINDSFFPGDFMLINGHISSFVPSPLIGENIDILGKKFPDMSEVYDKNLRELIGDAAKRAGIILKKGVYLQTSGPNYETPEEIKMYKAWGADAVGMSTACEAIAAHHAGMRVAAVSCISNMAAGISKTALSHEDVEKTTTDASSKFKELLFEIFKSLRTS